MVQRWGGLSGQRCGPGRVEASPTSGSTDLSQSVLLGSGMEEVLQHRCSSVFRWWFQAASILHGFGLWRFRSDLSPIWSGFVWWLVVWCRGWLWSDRAVLRRLTSARWLVAVWRRFDGDGTRRQRMWLFVALGRCGGDWVLDRANVLGPSWCILVFFFKLVCCYVFSVVSQLRISPPSVERGFGCFQVASMPLFWYLGCTVAPSLWLGLMAVPTVLPSHVVWWFWDTVLERVVRFIIILVVGLYLYTRVWLLPMVARGYGRIRWLDVGLVWLTEAGLFGSSATMVL
ncbi:hypothetical protein RchiOBHm_Chr2g0173981 [Rosa chinensis]|uniref:Transmembrane protein n=1 Tax=Rosa chinensis TaxID=74649 RepID=A0A2P6S609_ROSCH|nr:hypothetical protein RchiOBHm_Chr2g0173981 [Rosa chinensis]